MLEELRKVYLKNLNFDSLYLLIGLVNFFLMIRKLLKGIYIMKWYKKIFIIVDTNLMLKVCYQ